MSLRAHTQRVLSVGLSGDGRRAVTCGADGKLCVWSTEVRYTMQEVRGVAARLCAFVRERE